MERLCLRCGAVLNQYNPGKLCFPCQKKQLEQRSTYDDEVIDAEDFAFMLRLTNAQSVKRLGLKGKLPPRIPGIRKWLWDRSVVEDWLKQEGRTGNRGFRITARGIASNLSKCRYDPVICISLSDKIGGKVYGAEFVIGTGYKWKTEPIELVKVDRSMALNVLKQLPKKDFPELIGITDWADLTYERIGEVFIARLESYF